jgi:hypothetical protein
MKRLFFMLVCTIIFVSFLPCAPIKANSVISAHELTSAISAGFIVEQNAAVPAKVAYQNLQYGTSNIFTMQATDGAGQLRLTDAAPNNASIPKWSPDGTMIAYSLPGKVVIIDEAGNVLKEHSIVDSPVWSPDGKRIIYRSGSIQLSIWNLETNTDEIFYNNGDNKDVVIPVDWSPNGILVNVGLRSVYGPGEISETSKELRSFNIQYTDADYYYATSYSADGNQVLVNKRANNQLVGFCTIDRIQPSTNPSVINVGAGIQVPYATDWGDDNRIYFHAIDLLNPNGWGQIYSIKPDGSDLRQLTNDAYHNSYPSLQPKPTLNSVTTAISPIDAQTAGCSVSGGGSYVAGASVSLTATVATGWTFAGWSSSDIAIDIPSTNPLIFDMLSKTVGVIATFTQTIGPASILAIKDIPTLVAAGEPFSAIVKVQDLNYNAVTSFNDSITISLTNSPISDKFRLYGMTTKSATNGIATFDNLWVDLVKPLDQVSPITLNLTATSGLISGISPAFNVQKMLGVQNSITFNQLTAKADRSVRLWTLFGFAPNLTRTSTNSCFSIQQNSYVKEPTSTGNYRELWVQNSVLVAQTWEGDYQVGAAIQIWEGKTRIHDNFYFGQIALNRTTPFLDKEFKFYTEIDNASGKIYFYNDFGLVDSINVPQGTYMQGNTQFLVVGPPVTGTTSFINTSGSTESYALGSISGWRPGLLKTVTSSTIQTGEESKGLDWNNATDPNNVARFSFVDLTQDDPDQGFQFSPDVSKPVTNIVRPTELPQPTFWSAVQSPVNLTIIGVGWI